MAEKAYTAPLTFYHFTEGVLADLNVIARVDHVVFTKKYMVSEQTVMPTDGFQDRVDFTLLRYDESIPGSAPILPAMNIAVDFRLVLKGSGSGESPLMPDEITVNDPVPAMPSYAHDPERRPTTARRNGTLRPR